MKKQALKFIHKNFKSVLKYHDIERMSLTKLQEYLNQSYWLPAEIVLKIIIRWIHHDQEKRAENFLQLYHNVNEQALSQVTNHLDKEEKAIYQGLQDKFLPDYQEIEQELEDNTSFLSIAFSAVKYLENQEVDETFSSYITFPESLTESQYQYRAPASEYKPGLESSGAESGLLVMGTKEEPGESGAVVGRRYMQPRKATSAARQPKRSQAIPTRSKQGACGPHTLTELAHKVRCRQHLCILGCAYSPAQPVNRATWRAPSAHLQAR